MFIELAEALDCPVCRDGFGLVAFVSEADRRRVISGRLGCPMCEAEFPIMAGTIDFGGEESVGRVSGGRSNPDSEDETALATKLAALLGVGERDGLAVLLGEGLGAHAPGIARLVDRVEVIAVAEPGAPSPAEDIEDLAAGVDPVRGFGLNWPIRRGALDAIAVMGGVGDVFSEVSRCLAAGGRLVVIDPDPTDAETLAGSGFETLGADDRTWVGVRS